MFVVVRHRVQSRAWRLKSILSRRQLSLGSSITSQKVQNSGDVVDSHPVTHASYQLLSTEFVAEHGVNVVMYEHTQSKAQVMSVIADDPNKVFGVTFLTPPKDSTGISHIMEHSVLCGSRKYTSKEPFAELLKGSLQTFLNAFTYPDRTCFPVASQNLKDFHNLVNVYLDAVFYPRAINDSAVLAQEGWHYELHKPEDPLVYKGVVFNEMKGVYSDPEALLDTAGQQALFQDNAYSVNYGGDPLEIPNLTFENFKDFHKTFYHPSNSLVYFYGDDDPLSRLELLDEYLSGFKADSPQSDSVVATQPLYETPRRITSKYPISAADAETADNRHIVNVLWLLNEQSLSLKDELELAILDNLLLGTTTAPLYKAAIASKLGSSLVDGGVASHLKQATFSLGLKDVHADDVDKVESLIVDTLRDIAATGFPQGAVDAAINSIEFRLREFNTGSFPKGLSLMLAMLPRWIYETDSPADTLRFTQHFESLKGDLAAGEPVFVRLLQRLLVDNGHRVTVDMQPDPTLEEAIVSDEADKLAAIKAAMSESEIAGIIEATHALQEAQLREDSPEDLATLPTLNKTDMETKVRTTETEVVSIASGSATLLQHSLGTSGIVYLDTGFDLTSIPLSDIPLTPLFFRMLLEGGTSSMDATELQQQIGTHTGGISPSLLSTVLCPPNNAVCQPDNMLYKAFLRGKAVSGKTPELLDLMFQVWTDANLDHQERVLELLRESKSRLEQSFINSGGTYAAKRLSARNSFRGYVSEITGGLTYYKTVKKLIFTAENDWPSLRARLEGMRDTLLNRDSLVLSVSADADLLPGLQTQLDQWAGKFPTRGCGEEWNRGLRLKPRQQEGVAITSQVNYVVKALNLVQPGEALDGGLVVASRALSSSYLWDHVRVAGGAYGGGCRLGMDSGRLVFSSFRDPNLQETLDIYDRAVDFMESVTASDESSGLIDQSIIGTIGGMDTPVSADQEGWRAMLRYLSGVTTEDRQQFRDEILQTSPHSFEEFSSRLRTALDENRSNTCVFASEASLKDWKRNSKSNIHILKRSTS